MEETGKNSTIFRADTESNGHYLSLDFINGQFQGRIWGENKEGNIENTFLYSHELRTKR